MPSNKSFLDKLVIGIFDNAILCLVSLMLKERTPRLVTLHKGDFVSLYDIWQYLEAFLVVKTCVCLGGGMLLDTCT